jgi:PadR family transcriptional regulator, regulatory protein AphA
MDVRTICLGILTRGDTTGYEIKKLFEGGRFNYFVEASFGSIYPALNRLTQEGLVSVRAEAQAKRPDRKVYSITAKGQAAFVASLQTALPEDRYRSPFLFAMMFSDLMPNDRVGEMVDVYIANTEAKLAQLQCDCERPCNPREAFVCAFGRTVYEAMLGFLRDHRNDFNTDAMKAAAE